MGILLLKELLDKITLLFHLSSNQNIDSEPARKYYHKTEEILKRLHTVFAVLITGEDCDYQIEKSYEELGCFLDELKELFEAWSVLKSKVYLVLQVELLLSKILCCSLEILHLLESCEQAISVELNETSLEMCIQELKNVELEQISTVLEDAMRCQEEGKGPSPESMLDVAESLNMSSNQELLIEMVALERLKEDAEQNGKNVEAVHIDKMVSLVAHIHDHVVSMKHSQSCYHVMVPSDFCCPLSLKLMADPVIVASGQTYEKSFIKKWIDMGLTVCPKTRQPLSHTNLIPNYTVKAFIANWCESNNIKLPDPVKIANLCVPSPALPAPSNGESKDSYVSHTSNLLLPKSAQCFSFLENGLKAYGVNRDGELLPQTGRHSLSESSGSSMVTSVHGSAIGRIPVLNSEDEVSIGVGTNIASEGEQSMSSLVGGYSSDMDDANSFQRPPMSGRTSDVGSCLEAPESSIDVSENSNGSSSDVCGEGASDERRASPYMATRRREPDFLPRFEPRSRSHSIWRRSSDRFVPRIVSSTATETHPDHSTVEAQVRKLVEDLKSVSVDTQREASSELRRLTKDSMDNRIVIANCGAISILVDLLYSTDTKTQDDAVTALLNLSINDNNKNTIANAGAIDPLIHVLEVGSSEAKENSAATLFSLSVMEDNKILIGKSGAIGPLVDLLRNGTPRGKKDAATALFNLSILHENKARIVQTGAVRHLVGLMDPAAGMVDKAVAVLSNLATIPEGRNEIGQGGGIPVLVEVVELGSARGKENAAAALLQLCTHSSRFCNMVLQEGSVPPLVALSQSGTPRAKEKAQALLNCFRNQRGNAGRG